MNWYRTAQDDRYKEDADFDTMMKETVEDVMYSEAVDKYLYTVVNGMRQGLEVTIRAAIVRNRYPIDHTIFPADGMDIHIYRILKSEKNKLPDSYGYRALKVDGRADMYFTKLPALFDMEQKAAITRMKWDRVS